MKCIRYDLYIEECKPGKRYLLENLDCRERLEGGIKKLECNGISYVEMEVRYDKR
ncbi:hypothetical protein [Acidianus sulfidivorans]|uniref:hypothetical protein n=1 Tax=Acidianus sulfidivorans TaxID=312539 RepID=UPI00144340A1|nr:hypothetical protein [Acidianus sulfidivorans]